MMLKKLSLNHFRGIRHLEADGIKLVTIVAGRNNSGKSTLLEAVETLAGCAVGTTFRRVNAHREMGCSKLDEMKSFFYNRDDSEKMSIEGVCDSGLVRALLLERAEMEGGVSGCQYMLHYRDQVSGRDPEPGGMYFYQAEPGEDLRNEIIRPGNVADWRCAYCTACNEPKTSEIISELKQNCRETVIVEFLRQMDPTIADIMPNNDDILVEMRNPEVVRLPLQLMGDGIHKAVKILGLMSSVGPGGVVCIDEIENGLHHSVMRKFLAAIARIAESRNVQVLMTTHNIEMLRSASLELAERKDIFGYLKLNRYANGDAVAFPYDAVSFASSVKGGVELR